MVVLAVAAFVFAETPEPTPVADASLEPGLLEDADFPTSFFLANMTQAEMDQLSTPEFPETVNPTECSELVREVEPVKKSQSIAVVQASDAKHGIWYTQSVVRASEVSGWDPARADAVLEACAEMTYRVKEGPVTTLYARSLDGVKGEGYARTVSMAEDYGLGGVTMAVALTKVDEYIVAFVAVSAFTVYGPTFNEVEFVRLANAANHRVRTAL